MNKKQSLKQLKEFLENYDYQREEQIEDLGRILNTQNQLIYSFNNINVSMLELQLLDENDNLGYKLGIHVNGVPVWNSDIKNKNFKVRIINNDIFIINEEITCLPFDYICKSCVAQYPISTLKNAMDAEKEMDDVDDLIFDKEILEFMILDVQKYADRLDKNIANEEFIEKCFMAILPTFCYPLMQNHEKGIITMSAISIAAILYKLLNDFSTFFNTRLSIFSNARLMAVQMEYDKIIERLKLSNFESNSEFDKIESVNYNILLENNNLKIYVKETKGYNNTELFYQTSLFVNNIEFWNSGLKDSFLPVAYSRYFIYVFDEQVKFIPLEYIINSVLSDNPIETLNDLLESDVKVYRR